MLCLGLAPFQILFSLPLSIMRCKNSPKSPSSTKMFCLASKGQANPSSETVNQNQSFPLFICFTRCLVTVMRKVRGHMIHFLLYSVCLNLHIHGILHFHYFSMSFPIWGYLFIIAWLRYNSQTAYTMDSFTMCELMVFGGPRKIIRRSNGHQYSPVSGW